MKHKVVIIGGGPSGVFSAFYLKRFGVEDLVIFEKNEIGGLIKYANLVENFPLLKPTSGLKIVDLLKKYVNEFNIKVINEKVDEVSFNKDNFIVKTTDKKFLSKYLILSTGTVDVISDNIKDFVLEDYKEFVIKVKDKNICVIGGGDLAFDYSLNMVKRNNKIDIFIRSDKTKALDLLVKRAKEKGIKIHYRTEIIEVKKSNKLFKVFLNEKGKLKERFFDYIIPACGRKPYYGDIKNIDKILFNKSLKNRFFLAGDVKNEMRYLINCFSDAINIACRIKKMEECL